MAYLIVTLVLGVAGAAVVGSGGGSAETVAVGIGTAWLIQAVAFWMLWGALTGRRRVIPVWIGGMVARAGAIPVLWIASRAGRWSSRELLTAYVLAILIFLLMEAAWLLGQDFGARNRS